MKETFIFINYFLLQVKCLAFKCFFFWQNVKISTGKCLDFDWKTGLETYYTNNPGQGVEVGLLYLNQQENIYKIDGYFIS